MRCEENDGNYIYLYADDDLGGHTVKEDPMLAKMVASPDFSVWRV